jgi:TetR/AcrR family transcriptional regulator
MATTRKAGKGAPGRPVRQHAADAQAGIVNTACLHYSRYGIKGSNNRQIAEEAGVTPAMIHYYFKDKDALYGAVLETGFAPMLADLPGVATLSAWVTYFHSHLSARPWLPHLMIREVLAPEGLLRPLFLKHYAPLLFGFLKKLVAQELQGAEVRKGLDIDRHVVLLMGMLVYPFMTMDIAQNLTGRKFDQRMLTGFRDDALQLFLNGITAG